MKKIVINILFIVISGLPLIAGATELSVFGDLLVWHASEQPASTWASVISAPSVNSVDFDASNVDFHWNLGFRGGLAYEPKNDARDARLYWTYFGANTNTSFNVNAQIIAPEFFSGFVSENVFFGANVNWQLFMNMVDFDFGRKIDIGKSVYIRPAIGIKGGTIRQTINCQWLGILDVANEHVTHNFYGVGPTFSIDSKWHVYKSFSLIGDFATAFMWGKWSVQDTYGRPSVLFGVITTPTVITTTMNSSKLGTMMFDYFLGGEWIHRGRSIVTIQIGYEMQFWANQLRMPTFQQLPVHGDLTFQGATCNIRIDL